MEPHRSLSFLPYALPLPLYNQDAAPLRGGIPNLGEIIGTSELATLKGKLDTVHTFILGIHPAQRCARRNRQQHLQPVNSHLARYEAGGVSPRYNNPAQTRFPHDAVRPA